jgi:hypothetical protein
MMVEVALISWKKIAENQFYFETAVRREIIFQ